MNKYLKSIITRFRFLISDTAIHHHRYKMHTYTYLICPLCRAAQGNEFYFIAIRIQSKTDITKCQIKQADLLVPTKIILCEKKKEKKVRYSAVGFGPGGQRTWGTTDGPLGYSVRSLIAKQFFGPSWYTMSNIVKFIALIAKQIRAIKVTSDIPKWLFLSVNLLRI